MNISQQLKKAVSIIPKTNLILQEVLAVIEGIKPCLTMGLDKKARKIISREFPELTIECRERSAADRQVTICALSKERQIAKEIMSDAEKSGRLLGYPECCIKNHSYLLGRNVSYQHLVYQSHKNSKKHSFLTNDLFNFFTKIEKKEEFKRLNQYSFLNKNFPIPYFYLQFISHIPCSYDCQESIKIGKKIRSLLKGYAPDIEKVVTYTLSKPVLFFDLFGWVILDGTVKNNTLFYKKVVPPISLIDSLLLNKIKEGNKIIVRDDKIGIFKDKSPLYLYQKKNKIDGFILDFND